MRLEHQIILSPEIWWDTVYAGRQTDKPTTPVPICYRKVSHKRVAKRNSRSIAFAGFLLLSNVSTVCSFHMSRFRYSAQMQHGFMLNNKDVVYRILRFKVIFFACLQNSKLSPHHANMPVATSSKSKTNIEFALTDKPTHVLWMYLNCKTCLFSDHEDSSYPY